MKPIYLHIYRYHKEAVLAFREFLNDNPVESSHLSRLRVQSSDAEIRFLSEDDCDRLHGLEVKDIRLFGDAHVPPWVWTLKR